MSKASHSCMKRAALSAPSAVDGAGEVRRVVGDDADRPALDADQRGDHAEAEVAAQLEHRAGVGQRRRSRRGRRRRAAGSRGSTWRSSALVGALPRRRPGPGSTTGTAWRRATASASSATAMSTTPFGTCTDIGPTSSGWNTPRPPPSIIAGPPMPMFESCGGDDHVAAAEQRGVAGEAATRRDADERHEPAQLRRTG